MATLMMGLFLPYEVLHGANPIVQRSKTRLIIIAPQWRSISLLKMIRRMKKRVSVHTMKSKGLDSEISISELKKFISEGGPKEQLYLVSVVGGRAELGVIKQLSLAIGRRTSITGIVTHPFSFEGTHSSAIANNSSELLGRHICNQVHTLKNDDFIHQYPSNTPISKVFNHSDRRSVELLEQLILNSEKAKVGLNENE